MDGFTRPHPSQPLYTISTHPALISATETMPITPHMAPAPTLRGMAALQGKAGRVVAKKAVGLGPLVTDTVAALLTGAIGALVGDPEVGRMVKRWEVPWRTPWVEFKKTRT